jgi:hypothetical protein
VPGRRLLDAPPWSGVSTPPQGLSLRSGFFCPGPSTLISPIRPTRGHIAISPTLRLIRDAFAVRERLGDPRVVPSFRCIFLPDMPPSMSPGRSASSFSRKFDSDIGLHQDLSGSALPVILPSVSSRARISGLIGSPLLRPVRLLAPLDGSDRALPQPRGLLHPGFQRVSLLSRCWISLRQSLDFLSVGLSPTGIAASFAAPDPHVQNCCMRLLPRMYGVEAQIGIRMKDARFGEPALCKSHKSWPSRPIFLAASP